MPQSLIDVPRHPRECDPIDFLCGELVEGVVSRGVLPPDLVDQFTGFSRGVRVLRFQGVGYIYRPHFAVTHFAGELAVDGLLNDLGDLLRGCGEYTFAAIEVADDA